MGLIVDGGMKGSVDGADLGQSVGAGEDGLGGCEGGGIRGGHRGGRARLRVEIGEAID